ncbi:MAG: LysM peptidoglycan-binding domain-containing protein [Verrucomicrobia bacterium]|nr:LysM peptidoglycan-binding domain-containing protein [Verrucomicrobiota bacterium]
MTRFAVALASALLAGSLLLGGCLPASRALNEQEDSNYLNGRARVSSLDYRGAIEEFEKAIANNPNSSSAHLELALLHEEQMHDYAAAIYHYEKHLKLRPKSEYAERAKERIKSCKMDLVKTEVLGPVNQGMQRELERLANENIALKQRIETLESQLNARQAAAVQAVRQATPVPQPQTQAVAQPQAVAEPRPSAASTVLESPRQTSAPQRAAQNPRVHIVKSGEKLTTIARDYGVDLNRLMQANPGVSPTRLQIGQSLKIP